MTGSHSSRLTAARRAVEFEQAAAAPSDLIVVGGGVTGCGIALDAASRGLRVTLLEQADLANGTSRWSSKLVHGGLRYLAGGEWGLVWESARERDRLMRVIAPHLVRALPMVVPLLPGVGARDAFLLATGQHLGDGFRRAAGTPSTVLPRSRRLTAAETCRLLPAVRREGLRGGGLGWDGQLEDDARLVVAVARTAAAFGARVLTYARVVAADGSGVEVQDTSTGPTGPTGSPVRLAARFVVNATGAWAGGLAPHTRLRPSKGVHLVLPAARLGHPAAAMTVPVPGERNRFVFALPHEDGLVYVGLTDELLEGPVPDQVHADPAEIDFLLGTLSTALDRPVERSDVIGSFAGVRPLLDHADVRTADLSRRHRVQLADDGVWTVLGGKLTTYRAMAQDVVDGISAEPCRTARLPLVGAGPRPANVPGRLVRRYGSEAADVAALAEGRPELLQPVAPGLPVLGVELLWGVLAEGALTVADLVERRSRLSLVDAWGEAAGPAAAAAIDQLAAAGRGAANR